MRELVNLKKQKLIDHLQYIVLVDSGDIKEVKNAEDAGLIVLSFDTVLHSGIKSKTELPEPKADSIFTLCYTSGTTGNPKGVMISHKNILIMGNGLKALGIDFSDDDVHLSYLTLAHIFE